jgi:hypothetical protein
MAKHIKNIVDLKNINIISYPYSQLQTGDLLFFSGDYTFSKITKLLSKSIWTHVAMVVNANDIFLPNIKNNENVFSNWINNDFGFIDGGAFPVLLNPGNNFIAECTWPNGVRMINFDKAAFAYEKGKAYNGKIIVACRITDNKPEEFTQNFKEFLFSAMCELYDWKILVELGWKTMLTKWFGRKIRINKKVKPPYTCAEFVYFMYKYCFKRDFVAPDGLLIAETIWANPNIEILGSVIFKKTELFKFK